MKRWTISGNTKSSDDKVFKNQNERKLVRWPCIKTLREYLDAGILTKKYPFFYWSCPPDPGLVSAPQQRRLMKMDGYEKGVFDLCISVADCTKSITYLVEFKYGYNNYTPEQKLIAEKAEQTPVRVIKIKSHEEFIDFLDREFII